MALHPNPIISEDIKFILSAGLPWEEFRDKTILISGANGFLPAYLVFSLMALEETLGIPCKVIALLRNQQRGESRFSHLLSRPDFTLLARDVSIPFSVNEKIDFIIHAASQASPKYYGADPVGTLSANVSGTLNLLKLGSENGASRFLYFSSSEVYGQLSEEKIPTKETDFGFVDPTQVRACYAESKRMGENIAVSWMHQYSLPALIVRPFHTYGPGMALDDGRVYADFIADIVANRDIKLNSDGSAIRAFCYIADASVAFFTVLLKGEPGQAYNVGNRNGESSILQLANLLTGMYPEKNLTVIRFESQEAGYIKSVVSKIVPDTEKIRKLGWNASFNLEKGFDRTIKSYA